MEKIETAKTGNLGGKNEKQQGYLNSITLGIKAKLIKLSEWLSLIGVSV